MPNAMYCWRCKIDVPMLTEDEWDIVNPDAFTEQVKRYRERHGCSLEVALNMGLGKETLDAYERLTGFRETNPAMLHHHRAKLRSSMRQLPQATSYTGCKVMC